MDINLLMQSVNVDLAAIASQLGPWGLFGYLVVCKAAAVYCNNSETKDTLKYKIAEWFADNDKLAKQTVKKAKKAKNKTKGK